MKGKRVRKVITHDETMLRALAQKRFAQVALPVVEEIIGQLKNALDGIAALEPEALCEMLSRPYLLLPEDYLFDREVLVTGAHLKDEERIRIERHRGWGAQPFKQTEAFAEMRTILTTAGIYVRTKSEALIVEALYRYGIEFQYDREFVICGEKVAPDFTFEGSDGQLFFWEYMGMMDRPDYVQRNLRKLQLYSHDGYVPGDRLIVTFGYEGSINMEEIDVIIRNKIIPRL